MKKILSITIALCLILAPVINIYGADYYFFNISEYVNTINPLTGWTGNDNISDYFISELPTEFEPLLTNLIENYSIDTSKIRYIYITLANNVYSLKLLYTDNDITDTILNDINTTYAPYLTGNLQGLGYRCYYQAIYYSSSDTYQYTILSETSSTRTFSGRPTNNDNANFLGCLPYQLVWSPDNSYSDYYLLNTGQEPSEPEPNTPYGNVIDYYSLTEYCNTLNSLYETNVFGYWNIRNQLNHLYSEYPDDIPIYAYVYFSGNEGTTANIGIISSSNSLPSVMTYSKVGENQFIDSYSITAYFTFPTEIHSLRYRNNQYTILNQGIMNQTGNASTGNNSTGTYHNYIIPLCTTFVTGTDPQTFHVYNNKFPYTNGSNVGNIGSVNWLGYVQSMVGYIGTNFRYYDPSTEQYQNTFWQPVGQTLTYDYLCKLNPTSETVTIGDYTYNNYMYTLMQNMNAISSISENIEKLAEIYASEQEFEAREFSAENQQAVVDGFIDPDGTGSISSTEIEGMADTSGSIKENFDTGVSPSGIFSIFSTDDQATPWFSNETKNELMPQTRGEYNTPLLDEYYNNILQIFEVKR